jgi:ribosome-interacting GTPase 1
VVVVPVLIVSYPIRTCDLILIALDAMKPMTLKGVIENELEGFGIRLNKKPPNITFRKKDRGGS